MVFLYQTESQNIPLQVAQDRFLIGHENFTFWLVGRKCAQKLFKDDDNPLPDHIPLIPIVSDPSSDSENDYSKPFRGPNPAHHQPQHSDPSISHVSHEFDHHSTHTRKYF